MVKYNSFCLSLLSPVFHKMLCGDFKEKTDRRIELDDDEEKALRKVMELACGCEDGVRVRGVGDMMDLGATADQYGMEAVVSAVEEAVVSSVTVETCGEVLRHGGGGQLPRSESAAWTLALERFEAVSWSGGFLGLNESVMCSLVGDNKLAAEENAVLEAVVEWIKAEGGE